MPESFTKSTVMSPFAVIVKCVRTETLSTGPPEAPRIWKNSVSVKSLWAGRGRLGTAEHDGEEGDERGGQDAWSLETR